MSNEPDLTGSAEAVAFLQAHPEILVGRDALDKAEDEQGGDTFSIVTKPLDDVVLFQYFNADTLERQFAVALVNDEKAETYYRDTNQDDDEEEDFHSCPGCGAGSNRVEVDGPERYLYARVERCKKGCPEARRGFMRPVLVGK